MIRNCLWWWIIHQPIEYSEPYSEWWILKYPFSIIPCEPIWKRKTRWKPFWMGHKSMWIFDSNFPFLSLKPINWSDLALSCFFGVVPTNTFSVVFLEHIFKKETWHTVTTTKKKHQKTSCKTKYIYIYRLDTFSTKTNNRPTWVTPTPISNPSQTNRLKLGNTSKARIIATHRQLSEETKEASVVG